MAYTDKYLPADNLIAHIVSIKDSMDEQTKSYYAGFISVNAVTVYELAIKEILIEFAKRKHLVFGGFIASYLARINGKIKISDINDLVGKFGEKYKSDLQTKIQLAEVDIMNTERLSILNSYKNLIECRHKYVHAGFTTLTLDECITNYNTGKRVIAIIFEAMK